MKPLPKAPKPLSSGGNGTGSTGTTGTAPTSTASTGTAPAGITVGSITDNDIDKGKISTNSYKLNKLNTEKLDFTKDREMIIKHKFKYFRKSDKKGQIYSRQLFIVIRPQACSYIKILFYKDFTKNIVNIYLNYTYTIKISRRSKKNKFVKILYITAKFYKPKPLKESIIYILYKQKEENPI